jgi:hypothetical protein
MKAKTPTNRYSHEIERDPSRTCTRIAVYLVKNGERAPACFASGYVTKPDLLVTARTQNEEDVPIAAFRAMADGMAALADALSDELNSQLRVRDGLTP